MFISSEEKKYLFDRIKLVEALTKDMGLAATEITVLKAKIKVLEAKPAPKPKKRMTEAQRVRQREYARKYKAKKAAEKRALEQA
jgi:hypothetical protein